MIRVVVTSEPGFVSDAHIAPRPLAVLGSVPLHELQRSVDQIPSLPAVPSSQSTCSLFYWLEGLLRFV